MTEETNPERGPRDWSDDPLESLARELRESVGSEFRAEAEMVEIETEIGRLRKRGLHETLTWIVQEMAILCDAIHEEFLDPTNESVRARLRRQAGTSWFQQQSSSGGQQTQTQGSTQ